MNFSLLSRHGSRSIRSVLRWLVFACVVPAWAVTLLLIVETYQRERSNIEEDTIGTARALTQALDGELIGVRTAAQVLAASPYLPAGELPKFYDQAQEALRNVPGDTIVLLSSAGEQLLNTARPFGQQLPMQGVPDQVLRPFETGRPFISDLFVGPAIQRPLVSVVVPVFAGGKVLYALGIGMLPERLGEILRRQSLPPRWVAVIFDSTGTIVARTHNVEQFLGKRGSEGLVRRIAEVREGAIESTTLEGIPVLSSFSRSALSGWSVAIGIPTADVFGPLRWIFWLTLAGAGVLLLICLWLAQLVFAGMFRDHVEKTLQAIGSTVDREKIAHQSHDMVAVAGSLGCTELTACSRALLEAATQDGFDLTPLVASMTVAARRALNAIEKRYPS